MKKTSTMLKLAAATLAMGVMAGCASQASEEEGAELSQAQMEANETRSIAREALNTAQQAQRTAQQALQLAQQNRQEMERMFERSMRK
ncbi:MAG: Lpp/OprI family alanine-zipper lipoprotein [Halomonas sp.]|nr:Lpp/OprI family alanine-zipper lipoprotein [Halomonas sp.]